MSGQIIVITNQKGGSGKTTTAMHFAAALVSMGHSAIVAEADVSQASASIWASINGGPGFDVMSENLTPDAFATRVYELSEEYDYVIVDGVPNKERASLISLLGVADIAVVPTAPAPLDIWSTQDFCTKAKAEVTQINPDLKMAILLNKTNATRKNLLNATELMLGGPSKDIPVLKTRIADRNPFAAVPVLGKSVLDLSGKAYQSAKEEVLGAVKETLAMLRGA